MNKKQILALVITALLTTLAGYVHVGLPPEDVQNGFIALGWLVFCAVAHDANNVTSALMQKTTWTGIAGSIWWAVTMVFHVAVPTSIHVTIDALIANMQGYYTLNHSSAIHELQGTVGTPSPKFSNS